MKTMRKRLINATPDDIRTHQTTWMDLSAAALVEVTSEENQSLVEAALISGENGGWRAAETGTQTIRLIFDEPQRLDRIAVMFEETENQRTQEFVLRWSPDGGRSFREIVRPAVEFQSPSHGERGGGLS